MLNRDDRPFNQRNKKKINEIFKLKYQNFRANSVRVVSVMSKWPEFFLSMVNLVNDQRYLGGNLRCESEKQTKITHSTASELSSRVHVKMCVALDCHSCKIVLIANKYFVCAVQFGVSHMYT